jgi:hypothetical protein
MYADPVLNLASNLYADECRKRGAMYCGGFGFLSPNAKEPYIKKAKEQLNQHSKEDL